MNSSRARIACRRSASAAAMNIMLTAVTAMKHCTRNSRSCGGGACGPPANNP